MITAKWKPVEELVRMVRGHEKVLVAGCATCVAECAAGGEREVQTLAPLLSMAVHRQGGTIAVSTAMVEKQCDWGLIEDLADAAGKVDAIVSLACGIGVQALAEHFDPLPVYPGVNTTSLSIREEPGLWTARCAACGDCVLGETFGLCPVARCAKSLLNGPCGGTRRDGRCEVDEDTDCVWKLIWERAEARGQLERLTSVRSTKDWSESKHGGPVRMLREDLRS